jgi:hypothetical protein
MYAPNRAPPTNYYNRGLRDFQLAHQVCWQRLLVISGMETKSSSVCFCGVEHHHAKLQERGNSLRNPHRDFDLTFVRAR